MQICNIDARYSIKIKDGGGSITLLRHGEVWACEPPYSKLFIAITYRIEQETEIKNKAIEILKNALHDKYSDDPTMGHAYAVDPMTKVLNLLERKI